MAPAIRNENVKQEVGQRTGLDEYFEIANIKMRDRDRDQDSDREMVRRKDIKKTYSSMAA